jgi:hypothetical protein
MKQPLMTFLFLASSCGMQQKLRHRSVQQEIRHTESRHSDSLLVETKSAHLYLHTTDHKTIAELQPEGIFEYSPAQGFKGRARRVTIREVRQQATQSQDSSRMHLFHTAQSFSEEQAAVRVRNKAVEKETPRVAWSFVVMGGICILLVVLLYRRHLFH